MSTREVRIDGVVLDPEKSRKVRDHSPTGFCWGYGGSGPSQFALALLLEYALTEEEALAHYQDFKREVVAGLPQDDFELDEDVILEWLSRRRL